MNKSQMMKASAVGALAAVLVTASPAMAKPERERPAAQQSQSRGAERSQSRSESRPQVQPRAEARAQVQPRAEARAQVQPRFQASQDRSRGDDRASVRAAQQRETRAQVVQRQERATVSPRSTPSRPAERAQTRASRYDRGDVQQAYRDGRQAERSRDAQEDRSIRQDSYRDGYRDATRRQRYYDGKAWHDYDRWDNRRWRDDHRYDWYGYRTYNRSLFHLGSYYSPYRDYRYSRISIGFRLGSLFFGSRYWINDPWQYRLPAAYGPYRWIRYYDDVMLVDIYTGEVIDVIYDFFW